MSTDPNDSPALTCIDCGVGVEGTFGGIAICGDCLATRGSCCAESEVVDLPDDNEPRDYASPACYAHFLEDCDDDQVGHDAEGGVFHTRSGARLEYSTSSRGELEITHTFVPESLQVKGLACKLMKAVIGYAEWEKLAIRASCDYAKGYLQRKRGSSGDG